MKTPSEYEWVRYFQQEKIHLQQAVPVLKTLYPQVAGFLNSLGPHASDSVETWVDVLAWMTAGLKHRIDHRFSTWVESFLSVVSPELTHPFPSCGIVHMKVNPEKNAALDGYKIPKKTRLYGPLSNDKKAIFSVGMETEYQAFSLQGTTFAPLPGDKHYGLGLKISLRSLTHPEAYLGRTIRFAILGDLFSSQALYSAIHGQSLTTKNPTLFWQTQPNEAPLPLEKQTLGRVGWNPEDALCDYPYPVHPGRRLLLEYYAFPQRFLFFEITLPSQAPKNLTHDLDLWIVLPSFFDSRKFSFPPLCLALNACPVINLFPASSLPILVDHASEAYLLEVDTAQEKCLHHVQQVTVITEEETKKTIQPAFKAPLFNTREADYQTRWHIRKDATEKRERFWISFEGVPPEGCVESWYVHAHTLCYQPHCVIQEIQMDDGLVSEEMPYASFLWQWLSQPTEMREMNGAHSVNDQLWISERLLTEVTLKNLTLWLELYKTFQNPILPPEWGWIQEITSYTEVGRLHQDAWRGFVPQKRYVLTLRRDDSGSVPLFFYHLLDGLLRAFHPIHVLCQTQMKDAKTQEILMTLPFEPF